MVLMTPKKKYEYFGRGKSGTELSEYEPVGSVRDSNVFFPRHPVFDSSPSSSSSQPTFPLPNTFEYPPNPLVSQIPCSSQPIYHHPSYPNSPPPHIGIPSPYPADFSEVTSYSSTSYEGFVSSEDFKRPRRASNEVDVEGEGPPTFTIDDDKDELMKQQQFKGKGKKRAQRCRMCANHKKLVDMKGHKWYCKYRDCRCSDCDITRNCQNYMKKRQKLTRQQQQQHHHQHLQQNQQHPENQQSQLEETFSASQSEMIQGSKRRTPVDQAKMDFPREEEMVNEIKNILDYDLLEKVNQICRPRSSNVH
ncbi:UNVERIFIED_CONTAM: hypothetical protein RMT77_001422 [Armadillidium vulgare]